MQYDLRKPKLLGWVYALMKIFRLIDIDFQELRNEITAEYKFNGLKHSIEWLLNDRYDPIERRIHIVVVTKIPILFLKEDGEQPDAFLQEDGTVSGYYVWEPEDINAASILNYEMKIRVHTEISFDVNELLALIEPYRIAGVRPAVFTYGLGSEEEVDEDYNDIFSDNG